MNATQENTSVTQVELKNMANDLHQWAALLSGVSEITRDDLGEDDLGARFHVAAFTCDTINVDLCRIADRLNAIAKEGGAA